MQQLNDFIEYYKTLTNTELLSIVENPQDYQHLALEAAERELAERQLSDIDISEAKKPVTAEKIQRQQQLDKVKALEDKIKQTGHGLLEMLNPIQPDISPVEKRVRAIVVCLSLLFLYQFVKDFRTHISFAKDIPRFPFVSILYFFPLVLLPVAIIFFWKRKPIGWILLATYLAWGVVGTAATLLTAVIQQEPSYFHSGSDGIILREVFQFEQPSWIALTIQFVFFSGILWLIIKKITRKLFSIDDQTMAITIFAATVGSAMVLILIQKMI